MHGLPPNHVDGPLWTVARIVLEGRAPSEKTIDDARIDGTDRLNGVGVRLSHYQLLVVAEFPEAPQL